MSGLWDVDPWGHSWQPGRGRERTVVSREGLRLGSGLGLGGASPLGSPTAAGSPRELQLWGTETGLQSVCDVQSASVRHVSGASCNKMETGPETTWSGGAEDRARAVLLLPGLEFQQLVGKRSEVTLLAISHPGKPGAAHPVKLALCPHFLAG